MNNPNNPGFRKSRITLFAALLTVILLCALMALLFTSARSAYRNAVRDAELETGFVAASVAERASSLLTDLDLLAIAAGELFHITRSSANSEMLKKHLRMRISGHSERVGFLLIDANGDVFNEFSMANMTYDNLKVAELLQRHRKTWIEPTFMPSAEIGLAPGYLAVERGIWSSTGDLAGVAIIIADLEPSYEDRYLEQQINHGLVQVLTGTQDVIMERRGTFSERVDVSWVAPKALEAYWARHSDGQAMMNAIRDEQAGLVLARETVPGLPLVVLAQSPIAPFMQTYLSRRNISVAVVVLVAILVIVLITLIIREHRIQARTEKKLRDSDERLQFALSATNQGLWEWWMLTGETYYSSRVESMLGYPRGSMTQKITSFYALLHPDDRPVVDKALQAHFRGAAPKYSADFRLRAAHGNYIWTRGEGQVCEWTPAHQPVRMIGMIRDITKDKLNEINLVYAARHDPLLGLLNRSVFEERFARLKVQAQRRNSPFSLIYFDIDFFKRINDTHGHDVGDQVLKMVVTTVKNTLRSEEHEAFFRMGGEEFALMLPQTMTTEAVDLAERLRAAIEQSEYQTSVATIRVSASFGICGFRHDDDLQTFVARADSALYEAKSAGRNCVILAHDAQTAPPA